jgi:hypothetical protein
LPSLETVETLIRRGEEKRVKAGFVAFSNHNEKLREWNMLFEKVGEEFR